MVLTTISAVLFLVVFLADVLGLHTNPYIGIVFFLVLPYVNNIGHIDFPGCFRCHDDDHKSKDGKKIGQDCDTCHVIE
jgi:hypothetical protein